MDSVTTGIVTPSHLSPALSLGSTRIRVNWPLKHWPEAEHFQPGRRYSALIFQKVFRVDFARDFVGVKILDLCDPVFLKERPIVEAMLSRCDAVS